MRVTMENKATKNILKERKKFNCPVCLSCLTI